MNVSPAIPLSTAGSTSSAQTATQASSSASPAALALKKADARLQQQLETTGTQLSSLGKLKSALSDVQVSAHALRTLAASPATTATDIKAATGHFMTAFNAALGTAKTSASALTASTTGGAMGAREAGEHLIQSVKADPSTLDALHKASGFKQRDDGSLMVDLAKLDAALKADPSGMQSTLGKLGQAAETAATNELASSDHLGAPWAALSQHATELNTQASAAAALSASYVNQGIAAYKAGG